MAETLGTLCDKLTVVKLKQWHSNDHVKLNSLGTQVKQLQREIDEYVSAAVEGLIPFERLTFSANKVFRKEGNEIVASKGGIGEVFASLAAVNCSLWHEQEKVYDFENVPVAEKDMVVRRLAHLNLERTQCIDEIDRQFAEKITGRRPEKKVRYGG